MHERNHSFDPPERPGDKNLGGVAVPVKGNSSGGLPPNDPSDPVGTNLPKEPDPGAALVDLDVTVGDWRPPPNPSPGQSTTPSSVQASASLLQPGDVLGNRYEILQLLGEGGMGAVYRARDRELDRPVALKLIKPELASNPAILARFKQELLLARQVTHRNVVRIYDLGDAGGVKFITMEFVNGCDLRAIMREKEKFSPE